MNIYVGNLPFSATDEDLSNIFSEYGKVDSAKVIVDRETGRSKGFGFVEMSDTAARKAIETLDEADYEGKQISVNEARPKTNNRTSGNNFNRRSW
ncbi:MAG: RNA-binding protein [Ignavibacteria bacterium GWF2_33_9]|nr:MAG: RNA-binding protein [Ignavibacteria bacterium GWF2_33_9]